MFSRHVDQQRETMPPAMKDKTFSLEQTGQAGVAYSRGGDKKGGEKSNFLGYLKASLFPA